MKKQNNTKALLAALIIMLTCMLAVTLSLSGCGKKSAEEQEMTTQSLPTEAAQEDDTETTVQFTQEETAVQEETTAVQAAASYTFRNRDLLKSHYRKHGIDMGFDSPEEYQASASAVINNPDALTKVEKEDGDMVYYVESTNEFVVLSTDGYIRTYFLPDSGKRYFDRQ